MSLLSKQARQNQALAEIDSLTRELTDWKQDWVTRDCHEDGSTRGQYKTQLDSVYSEVSATGAILRKSLCEMSLDGDAGAVYGQFARAEREVLWLWRVFYFFRDKFQQRRDSRFGDTLRAADEVVWSCHRPFFQIPGRKKVAMPAPLPFIKPEFSPAALRRDQRQALDRMDSDFVLVREAFRQLPVPILAIPITAIHSPWALVLIGHEAGHIVEPLLEDDFNTTFQSTLSQTVEKAGGCDDDQKTWSDWGDEIFADLYSVLTMGPWAVWAMAQFEAADAAAMGERRFVYPAPCVRLQLIAAMASRFGLRTEIPPAPESVPDEVARDAGYVDAVAEAITTMPAIQALAKAIPFDKSQYEEKDEKGLFGEVQQWNRHLTGKGACPQLRDLRSARMAAAGTAQAWSETIFVDDSPEARTKLCELAVSKIAQAGPLDVRSSAAVAKPKIAPGQSLLAALRRADALIEEADAGSH
jgi:hypothetical protein